MPIQDRPAQALKLWEDAMFLAGRMHTLGVVPDDGSKFKMEGSLLHWPRFRAHLTAGTLLVNHDFTYEGENESLRSLGILPVLLSHWVRGSKRLYRLDTSMLNDCLSRGTANISFGDILLPHSSFGISLEGTTLKPPKSKDAGVDTVLCLGMNHDSVTRIMTLGLPLYLNAYQPLTPDERSLANSRFSTARVRSLLKEKWLVISVIARDFQGSASDSSGLVRGYENHLLTGFCQLMANGNVVLGRRPTSHLGTAGDESPQADIMSEDICAVTASGVITVGQLIDGTPTGAQRESTGSVATHERRAHYRRPPGSQPTDPKTVRVRSCWVNEDSKSKVNSIEGKINDVRDS